MFRFSVLEEAERYLMSQNIAAYLSRDAENPDLSNLMVNLGGGVIGGFENALLLNLIFCHGEDKWEELAADVLQVRSALLSDLSDSAIDTLNGMLSFILPQLDAGCVYVDTKQRTLVFSHDIVITRSSTVDSIISQLDGFLLFTVISAAVFFDPLFDAVFKGLSSEQGIELIRERAVKAEEAVKRRRISEV